MKIKCYKYHGAGNDFVIADNRDGGISLNQAQIRHICDRRFGIGADGFMLLNKSEEKSFSMVYFNSDGFEGSMCGNGGRCITAFADKCGISDFEFSATDGPHSASILNREGKVTTVSLKMKDVSDVTIYPDNKMFINTGSPHLIIFPDNFDDTDVDKEGRYWRHHSSFPEGTNVNFVKIEKGKLFVRTFERGVEAETLACGTGVTASVLAFETLSRNNFFKGDIIKVDSDGAYSTDVDVLGGHLNVKFRKVQSGFEDIWLTGPAQFVFECNFEF